MTNLSPSRLVFNCYARKKKRGGWYGVCLELNLAAEADSPNELKKELNSMIVSYIETVLNTKDHDSIPALLERRAPLLDWIKFYWIKALITINNLPGDFTFKQAIPFHLAHNHC